MTPIHIDAARDWLRDHLPDDEPVELLDDCALERAAAVVTTNGKGAQ